MEFGLFFISDYQNAKMAFSAFEERGLLGKRFTSKLSKIDPVGQLSEWLVLVRLLSTLERNGPGELSVRANRKLAHSMVFDYEEFCINKEGAGYEISTSTEIDRMADGILGIVKVPIAWALYEDANDAFWQMVTEYRMDVPSDVFEKDITSLYRENCAKYFDTDSLCKGTWMSLYDKNAPFYFGDYEPDEEYPSFTFTFYKDNRVSLSGWVLGALQVSNARLNRSTGEITLGELVLGRIDGLKTNDDGEEELTIEMYYHRDTDCPEEYFDHGRETPIEYIKKEDDRYSKYVCKRIERQ